MSQDQFNKPRGHVFDGIQEYDNDLPRWWVGLFIATIIFSIGYLAWYGLPIFAAKDLVAEYEAARAEASAKIAAQEKAANSNDGGGFKFAAAIKDASVVSQGKETFMQICASCHGALGEGLVGPNLTDEFWLHGHKITEIEAVVNVGVPEKGMPAWKDILGTEKIRQLVVYIKTLEGTNPPNAKASQGTPGGLLIE